MSDPTPFQEENARQEAEWDWLEKEQRREKTMGNPYHQKSMPEKLRGIANDLDDLFDSAGGGKTCFEDVQEVANPDTLRELADELQALLAEAAGGLSKPIHNGLVETHVAEMVNLDDLYTAVLDAKNGTSP